MGTAADAMCLSMEYYINDRNTRSEQTMLTRFISSSVRINDKLVRIRKVILAIRFDAYNRGPVHQFRALLEQLA